MDRVSSFGRYSGYTQPAYDSVVRSSQYVTLRDGVKVAVDVFLPARDGVAETAPLPVALTVTRYWRARLTDTGLLLGAFGPMPAAARSLKLNTAPVGFNEPARGVLVQHMLAAHGYAFVCFENRGTGASFGTMGVHGDPGEDDAEWFGMMRGMKADLYDMVAWCASQPFSNGKVAMTGGSWLGSTQLFAAAAHPPALTAITPNVPSAFHSHRISHFGGVFYKGAMVTMGRTLIELARNDGQTVIQGVRIVGPPPVDEDPSGDLLREARAGHGEASFDVYFASTLQTPAGQALVSAMGVTDHAAQLDLFFSQERLGAALREHPSLRQALEDVRFHDLPATAEWARKMHDDVSSSGVPSYWIDGWRDPHPHDRIVMFRNHRAPRRLMMGPWGHGPKDPLDQRDKESCNLLAVETLRWFDRWVKDVDNGVDTEDPIAYAEVLPGPTWRWRHAKDWPPPAMSEQRWFLGADGALSLSEAAGEDSFTVDYTATSGESTFYASAAGGPPAAYGDMRDNDAKGLCWTSAPFEKAVVLTGSPVVHAWVRADRPDTLLVVHVEEVRPDGRSELIKQGFLRASHRKLRDLPYDNMGVPFFSSLPDDVAATPPLDDGEWHEVVIPTEPMAHAFQAGSAVRITLTGADEGVIWAVPQDPPPTITVRREGSYVVLPVSPA